MQDSDGNIRTIEAYSRSFSASQLSKIAVTGVSLLKNQKDHIEITKEILHKQDEHIGISRKILHKQDEHNALTKEGFNNILSKQEKHINATKPAAQRQAWPRGLRIRSMCQPWRGTNASTITSVATAARKKTICGTG